MIKLRSIIEEIEDDQTINVDRLVWNQSYLDESLILLEGRPLSTDYFGLGQIGPYETVEMKWIPSIEYHGAEHSGRFMYRTNQRFRFHFDNGNERSGMVYWGAEYPTKENLKKVSEYFIRLGIDVIHRDSKLNKI